MATMGLLTRTLARHGAAACARSSTTSSMRMMMTVRGMSTYYTPAHEYIKVDGNIGTVGITDFAQAALGDIVYVDLPDVDDEFDKGDSFGSVESVKAASDVYAPVTGKVTAANEELSDDPGKVNTEAEGQGGWFIQMEISDAAELDSLMDEAAYKEHCEKES